MPVFFFLSSSRPSTEAVCTIRHCGILIDFSDGKTLRSLDLSERFRGAESDNEKGSREGGDVQLPSSHCRACVLVGVFHRRGGLFMCRLIAFMAL